MWICPSARFRTLLAFDRAKRNTLFLDCQLIRNNAVSSCIHNPYLCVLRGFTQETTGQPCVKTAEGVADRTTEPIVPVGVSDLADSASSSPFAKVNDCWFRQWLTQPVYPHTPRLDCNIGSVFEPRRRSPPHQIWQRCAATC